MRLQNGKKVSWLQYAYINYPVGGRATSLASALALQSAWKLGRHISMLDTDEDRVWE